MIHNRKVIALVPMKNHSERTPANSQGNGRPYGQPCGHA